ncbi:MAG: FHA domain-containing protein [Anaerolineales bacterium]|nr:FHA domain-containing protein [Anaerolineales bacterium]MCB9127714.1 FHA domain-containing protein [Ardenticatenales bacterium]
MVQEDAMLITVSTLPNVQVASRWQLGGTPLTVGRHPGSDVYLPDRQVSREHARIFRTTKGFFIEDLRSKNGTFINGKRIHRPTRLHDGAIIQIGLAFRLSFVGAEGTVPISEEVQRALSIRLDEERKVVWVQGQPLDPPLSPAQFDLLQMLVDAQGGVVERDDIAEQIWGSKDGVSEQAIDALVRRLRRRLEEVDDSKEYIVTMRGHGFRIEL